MLLGVERMPLKIIEKDSSERFIDTPIDSNPPIDIAERKLVWLFSRSQLLYFQSEKSSHHVALTGSLSLSLSLFNHHLSSQPLLDVSRCS